MENNFETGAFVIALTELIKSWGIPSNFCPTIAVFLAVGMTIVQKFTTGPASMVDWYNAILQGIVVGMTSTGLYRAGKGMIKVNQPENSEETY